MHYLGLDLLNLLHDAHSWSFFGIWILTEERKEKKKERKGGKERNDNRRSQPYSARSRKDTKGDQEV